MISYRSQQNSAGPADFQLGSIESRAAARALLEQRRKQGKRIALIWLGSKPEWFPSDHGKHRWPNGESIEIFCTDAPDYPRARREAGSEGKVR
jgi:hypothetical protein